MDVISSQEATLNTLDKVTLGKIDFRKYMAGREEGEQRVKSPSDYKQELKDRILGLTKETGAKMPWEKTHSLFRFRPGEVTTWVGFNGAQKSMVTGYVALGLMEQEEKVCIASFEMKPTSTLERLSRQATGKGSPTMPEVDEFLRWCEGNLYLYDQQGSVKADTVIGVIYYAAEQLGVTHFIVDSLMRCVRGEDAFNEQKDFMDNLCRAAMELNIHIHVVHHSRKRQDESERPGKMDTKGSGSIVDQTFNLIVVFKIPRDKKSDSDPDTVLHIDKHRNGEWEGKVVLYFDPASLQFHGSKGEKTKVFLDNNARVVQF